MTETAEQKKRRLQRERSSQRQIEGFRKLVVEILAGDDQSRFAEASRICALAHQFVVAQATRIDQLGPAIPGGDLDQHPMMAHVMNHANAVLPAAQPMFAGRRGPIAFGADDQTARDDRAAVAIKTRVEADGIRAAAASMEVQELAALSALLDKLDARGSTMDDFINRQRVAVRARIDQLTTRLEGRAHADVVRADDEGRHQPAGAGRRPHPPDGQGAVADGA